MSTGRDLLVSIEAALADTRSAFRALDLEMQARAAALARTRSREASLYRQLAEARLADIADGEFGSSMSRAERDAAAILDAREAAAAELNGRIEAAEAMLAEREGDRGRAADARDDAARALDALLEDVDSKLAGDDDYRRRAAAAQQAVDTAANAAAKTAEAEARRDDKRVPFDEDPLFSYLWSQGYGTPEYRAGLIARFFDRLVARHVRYEPARRKYFALTEIPRRLRAHTARMEAEAVARAEALAQYERDADLAAGAAPLERALDETQARVDAIDADIEADEDRLQALYAERDTYSEARDARWLEAMTVLDEALRQEPMPELRREAALTPDPDDDALVAALADVADEQDGLVDYLDDHRDQHAKQARRVDELSSIRRRYKAKRFDAPHSRIRGRGDVEELLAGFLSGLVSGEGLWRAIRKAQRFNRPPKMASGHRPRGVRVRFPGSRGGFGRGGFGGGGFGTKGGF